MKTATTKFLPVLLVCFFCFAIGCGQQVADPIAPAPVAALSDNQPQEKTDPLSTTIENNGDAVPKSNNNDLPVAVAGAPSVETPSPPQTPDSGDQVADAPPQPTNDTSPSNTDNGSEEDNADEEPAKPTINIPAHWKQLSETQEIWVDHKNKQVIVGGKVCFCLLYTSDAADE